ncbi:aspartate kinase [Staphylococcus sp. 11261D007BR]
MKVSKFGGSSVATAAQIKKVLNIVNSDEDRAIVIVSAPGKRYDNDVKTTDLLIRLYEKVIAQLDYTQKKLEILARFEEIVYDLDIDAQILKEIDRTLEHLIVTLKDQPARLLDALKSSGENFNAQIIAAYNNAQGIPTVYLSPKEAGVIVTNEPGNAQIIEDSYQKIYKLRNFTKKIIIPGFFGYSEDNDIVTFPRGGSDITGAIIARGVHAELYENFTDVSGIFRANPTLIQAPEMVSEITYREMRELSYAGFGVFHDEALQPLYHHRIPVVIKNTNRPSDPGTFIVHDRPIDTQNVITGISCDEGFLSINIKKYLMNRQVGFTYKVLKILNDYNISFDHMPSGIDNISIIMRSDQLKGKEKDVLQAIQRECQVDELSIEHDLAILMIVGEGMSAVVGTANKITDALAQANINLKMINQGSSEISMMFGLSSKDANKAVKVCYNHCFTSH